MGSVEITVAGLGPEREALAAVHRQAFSGRAEAQLILDLDRDGAIAVSVLARSEPDQTVIGHALWSRLTGPLRALALAPVAVAPPWQGRGVGSALIRSGLAWAKDQGWQGVFVLGAADYYGRFGFSQAAAAGYDCPYQGEHFLGLLWDASAARTGPLTYAAAFQALEDGGD